LDKLSLADSVDVLLSQIAEHVDAIPDECKRLTEYLKDPGAGRDASFRSADAQRDHAKLTAIHPKLKAVLS
jgi:hypothetical protein